MDSSRAPAFSQLAPRLVAEAGRQGLRSPSFRTPPRLPGATRTMRRYHDGRWLVSVQYRGRDVRDVAADMVEGVVRANGLTGPAARRVRAVLLDSLLPAEAPAA